MNLDIPPQALERHAPPMIAVEPHGPVNLGAGNRPYLYLELAWEGGKPQFAVLGPNPRVRLKPGQANGSEKLTAYVHRPRHSGELDNGHFSI